MNRPPATVKVLPALQVLPVRTAGAAENMALDFLLLQRYPAVAPRFRHYEWRGPAFTFGYSQKIEFVRGSLPPDETVELCRRPTGGGVVDHRHDWTYALVVPRGHPLYDERASQSYRVIHEGVAQALVSLGQPAELKLACETVCGDVGDEAGASPKALQPGVCFQRSELYDVVQPGSGRKIAGAAQKRNKHGLLFQGSIEKSVVGTIDWDEFQHRFVTALATALGVEAMETPWPELNEDEVSGLIDQYSDPQWNEYR